MAESFSSLWEKDLIEKKEKIKRFERQDLFFSLFERLFSSFFVTIFRSNKSFASYVKQNIYSSVIKKQLKNLWFPNDKITDEILNDFVEALSDANKKPEQILRDFLREFEYYIFKKWIENYFLFEEEFKKKEDIPSFAKYIIDFLKKEVANFLNENIDFSEDDKEFIKGFFEDISPTLFQRIKSILTGDLGIVEKKAPDILDKVDREIYFSRSFYERYFDRFVKEKLEKQGSCYVWILDVDDFKQINTIFWYFVGDKVLIEVMKWLHWEKADFFVRYGWEEFYFLVKNDEKAYDRLSKNRFEIDLGSIDDFIGYIEKVSDSKSLVFKEIIKRLIDFKESWTLWDDEKEINWYYLEFRMSQIHISFEDKWKKRKVSWYIEIKGWRVIFHISVTSAYVLIYKSDELSFKDINYLLGIALWKAKTDRWSRIEIPRWEILKLKVNKQESKTRQEISDVLQKG